MGKIRQDIENSKRNILRKVKVEVFMNNTNKMTMRKYQPIAMRRKYLLPSLSRISPL